LWSGRLWKIATVAEVEQAIKDAEVKAEQTRKDAIAKAEQKRKETESMPFFKNGSDAFKIKDYDGAITNFTQGLLINPDFVVAYNLRGGAYFYKGDWDNAIKDADEGIRLDPNNVSAYSTRANAYYMKKDYNNAIADYEAALRLDPNNAGYKKNLGIVKKDLEKEQKAQGKKKK